MNRLKWTLSIIALLVIVAAGLWWLFAPRDDGTLAAIRRRGTLRVGLDASFPPFEAIGADGRMVGFDPELAQSIAADLGVQTELVNIGFDGLIDALLARRVDVVISGLPNDPRWTQDVLYRNYFNAGQVLLTADESLREIDQLAGETVAVEWGSQAEMEGRRLAQTVPGLTLLRQPTAEESLAAVVDGRVGATIVDGVSGIRAEGQGLRLVQYLADDWYAVAVHIRSRELYQAIDQTLRRLEETGEMDRLQEKWLRGP
jgi:ABC-type amino acid transport substrate-binding protein